MEWVILTGEYPPQPGGVSDYTRLLAEELVGRGDSVQAWAPHARDDEMPLRNLTPCRLPDQFGVESRRVLNGVICELPTDARVLVQYVPQTLGWRGMNVPFCLWLGMQRRRCPIDVMFHEVATPWGRGLGVAALRKHILAIITRLMTALVGRAAQNIYVSIPGWKKMLEPLVPRSVHRSITWLPVPSTIPVSVNPARVAEMRADLCRTCGTTFLVGHFGTFGTHIATGLELVLPKLLAAEPEVAVVLIGRGSAEFVEAFSRLHPAAGDRLMGTGSLPNRGVAEHLAACDLLLQPYADGVSTRRTSMMAGLALGRPIVTTFGYLSESIWRESGAVHLVDSFAEMAQGAGALLRDRPERERLGRAAAALYRERFSIDRTIETLRSQGPQRPSTA